MKYYLTNSFYRLEKTKQKPLRTLEIFVLMYWNILHTYKASYKLSKTSNKIFADEAAVSWWRHQKSLKLRHFLENTLWSSAPCITFDPDGIFPFCFHQMKANTLYFNIFSGFLKTILKWRHGDVIKIIFIQNWWRHKTDKWRHHKKKYTTSFKKFLIQLTFGENMKSITFVLRGDI